MTMNEAEPNNSHLYIPFVLIFLLIYTVFSLIKYALTHSLKTDLIERDENHSIITDQLSMWVASYLTSTLGILTMLRYVNSHMNSYQYIIPTWPYLLLIVLICILLYFYNFTNRYFLSIMFLIPIFILPSIMAIPFTITHYSNFTFLLMVISSYFLIKIAIRYSWSLGKILMLLTVLFCLVIALSIGIQSHVIHWDLALYYRNFNFSYLYYYIMYSPVLIIFHTYTLLSSKNRDYKLMSVHYLIFLYFPLLIFLKHL